VTGRSHFPRPSCVGGIERGPDETSFQPVVDVAQLAREVDGRGVSVLGVLLETAIDDPAERRGNLRVQLLDRRRLGVDDGRQRLDRRLFLEGPLAGRHLVKDRAARELVAAEVDRAALGLLGRHVADRAHQHAGARRGLRRRVRREQRVGLVQLREAEVEDLDEVVARDHQVLGLQVAVDDPDAVGARESFRCLRGEAERPLREHRPRVQQRAQRVALDQLHRDVGDAVALADVVDRDDVRVVERAGRARFGLESPQPVRIFADSFRKNLQRHLAAQQQVARAVDFTHPARTSLARISYLPSFFPIIWGRENWGRG
jgi:hypothetical protein